MQVFSALLAWEMPPSPEQMQEICGSIMRAMPIWPNAQLKARWEPLVGDLEAMVALYEVHGKVCLQHVLSVMLHLAYVKKELAVDWRTMMKSSLPICRV